MRNKEQKPIKKVHLDNFHIAGFGYWEGCEAFEHLKIGTKLELVREEDNRFDPYAVAIYYGEYKLGFIPRGSNRPARRTCVRPGKKLPQGGNPPSHDMDWWWR